MDVTKPYEFIGFGNIHGIKLKTPDKGHYFDGRLGTARILRNIAETLPRPISRALQRGAGH